MDRTFVVNNTSDIAEPDVGRVNDGLKGVAFSEDIAIDRPITCIYASEFDTNRGFGPVHTDHDFEMRSSLNGFCRQHVGLRHRLSFEWIVKVAWGDRAEML